MGRLVGFTILWCYVEEDPKDLWRRWSYTTIDGGNVSKQEVEAARAQLDSRTFRQEFEASFENLTGLVAISFSDDNISTEAKDISIQPLLLGVDFNVDPMSGICAVKDQDTLYVFDEIMLTGGATTWDFAEEVTRRYGVDRRVIACPDPTGGARKTSGVGVTDHAILRRSGFTVQSPRSPWKIRDKITAVNTGLMDASGTRRVKIHPRCKELIKSLRTLTYAPGTGLPNKNLGVDHAFDAFGYLVLQQFNLAKPEAMGTTSTAIKDVSSAECASCPKCGSNELAFWGENTSQEGDSVETVFAASVITVGGRCSHLRRCWTRQFWSSFHVGSHLRAVQVTLEYATKSVRLGVSHCVMPGHYGAGGKKKPNGKKKGMKKGSKKMRCSCGK